MFAYINRRQQCCIPFVFDYAYVSHLLRALQSELRKNPRFVDLQENLSERAHDTLSILLLLPLREVVGERALCIRAVGGVRGLSQRAE